MDRTCKRYSQRPSSLVGITDPAIALDFDIAMAAVHRAEDESRITSLAETSYESALLTATMMS